MNSGVDYEAKPDSVGPPVPVVTWSRCVDSCSDEPDALPVGEIGELWIKGPNVVKGYWGKPEATGQDVHATAGCTPVTWPASTTTGFVYIVDRAKDMLIRGGENVYCVEIESVLYRAPGRRRRGRHRHPPPGARRGGRRGRRPPAGRQVTADELQLHVAARLAAFKVPVRIWFRAEPLPRNPAGKILKRSCATSWFRLRPEKPTHPDEPTDPEEPTDLEEPTDSVRVGLATRETQETVEQGCVLWDRHGRRVDPDGAPFLGVRAHLVPDSLHELVRQVRWHPDLPRDVVGPEGRGTD